MAYGWGKQGGSGGDRTGGIVPRTEAAPGKRSLTEMAYPYRSEISSSTGTSIPGKAVHDPGACEERGVPAFTDGDVTYFASDSPELHVAAHEAAHQL